MEKAQDIPKILEYLGGIETIRRQRRFKIYARF